MGNEENCSMHLNQQTKWFKINFIIMLWLQKLPNMISICKNVVISSTILRQHGTSDPIKSSPDSYITVVEEPRESFIFTLVYAVTGFMKYLKMTPEPVRQQTGSCSNNVKLQQKQDSRPCWAGMFLTREECSVTSQQQSVLHLRGSSFYLSQRAWLPSSEYQ